MVDVSVIVPGYRHWEWNRLIESTKESVGDLSFEIIFVGPDVGEAGPPKKAPPVVLGENCTFIRDLGAPGRCLQRGAVEAKGKYLTWACDDGVFTKGSLSRAVNYLEDQKNKKLALALNYYEGGDIRVIDFFRPRYHADQQMPGIKEEYRTSAMFMCDTEYYKELGGLDCRFEHVNFNIHDFMFRVYNDGGEVQVFMEAVIDIAWDVHAPDYVPVRRAYLETDLPLYQEMYSVDQSDRTTIPLDNWKESPEVWEKRFAKK